MRDDDIDVNLLDSDWTDCAPLGVPYIKGFEADRLSIVDLLLEKDDVDPNVRTLLMVIFYCFYNNTICKCIGDSSSYRSITDSYLIHRIIGSISMEVCKFVK
jgi:hypothetical protein